MSESTGHSGAAEAADDATLPVNATLRRVAVIFRLLGWGWLIILGILTLIDDKDATPAIVVGTMALASAWTVVTLLAAKSHATLSRVGYVIADGIVALLVLSASTAAGAEDFFHGGYPMSWLGVAAYAWGLRGAFIGSLVLAVEQGLVEYIADKPLVPIAGSVTFIVFAVVAGWGFSALRISDRERLEARRRLADESELRARSEERVELANRLHDSVLQTLIVMRRQADDPDQVRYLARRQERQLRHTINEYRSPYENSLRAALLEACGDIEDLYRVAVEAVISGDASADGALGVAALAAQEALTNAAKHSGEAMVFLTADLVEDEAKIFVRDKGRGFDPGLSHGGGLDNSLKARVDAAGGEVEVRSRPGEGTEISITIREESDG
jgi:signal transduction histidine kinase